jgi:ABC-type transport system involved in cytochrome bd biosynthesis fused ATPase/permease subunit
MAQNWEEIIIEESKEDLEANVRRTNSNESTDGTLQENIQLSDISLNIKKGEFIWVIGEVGSGKSSLLSAILGDMIYLSDETIQQYGDSVLDEKLRLQINKVCEDNTAKIKLGGTISYVQQMPWIRNCTIRENILFNLPMDEARYNRTIEICQLASDLEMLPGGDLTEIGEKGINSEWRTEGEGQSGQSCLRRQRHHLDGRSSVSPRRKRQEESVRAGVHGRAEG